MIHARRHLASRIFLILVRFGFGSLFLYTGLPKIFDLTKFTASVAHYDVIPASFLLLAAASLAWLEVLLAVSLFTGLNVRGALLACAGLFLVFGIAQVHVLREGLDIDCGCGLGFGPDKVSLLSVVRSFLLMTLALGAAIAAIRAALRLVAHPRIRSPQKANTLEVSMQLNLGLPPVLRQTFAALALLLGAWGAIPLYGATETPATRPVGNLETFRRTACAAYQVDFDALQARANDQPKFQAYLQRVADMEALARVLASDLAVRREAFLAKTTATVRPQDAASLQRKAVGATKIEQQYLALLAGDLDLADMAPSDRELLAKYYVTYAEALARNVVSRVPSTGQLSASDRAEMQQLGTMFPLLTIPDRLWTPQITADILDILGVSRNSRALEEYALRVQRPLVAYQIAQARTGHPSSDTADPQAYAKYLGEAADTLFRAKQYPAGVRCMRQGIASLRPTDTQCITMRLRLAEVLADTEGAEPAAEEAAKIAADTQDVALYAKATVLQLKYLYQGGKYAEVMTLATQLQKDERCKEVLPQVLYIGWVASRQGDNHDNAEAAWRKMFLERFADHPLAADIYFASAMSSLASSNYAEALKTLEYIESQFPDSRLIPKVKEIKQRIKAAVNR